MFVSIAREVEGVGEIDSEKAKKGVTNESAHMNNKVRSIVSAQGSEEDKK